MLYDVCERLASENITEAIVYFSTGKDSIVTLDLCKKYLKNIKIVYLYYHKNLKYRDDFIKQTEDYYNQEIIRYPHYELTKYINENVFGYGEGKEKVKLLKMQDIDNYFKKLFNIQYVAYGYRKTDSLSRRGIIWHGDGIDKRNKKLYPVANFNEKDIFYYIEKNKLKLPIEYEYGFRDINVFCQKKTLTWLKNTFYDDFLTVCQEYPYLESILYRD